MKISRTLKAFAKINIGLRILSKRQDGYHNIESVFYPVSLHDIIKISIKSFSSSHNNIYTETNDALLTNQESNLAFKAAKLFLNRFGYTGYDVKIKIDKHIPIGGGLGGGSSDAAAVLKFLSEAFGMNEKKFAEIKKLALLLGSDVPFFLYGKPAYAYSRGEKIKILNKLQIPFNILMVNPTIHVSTPWAYKTLNIKKEKTPALNRIKDFKNNNAKLFINDFEKPVFKKYPEVKKVKEDMIKLGAEFSSMSGSGSTVYGFFNNENIKKAVSYFTAKKYYVFVSKNPS
jgi:4-diphosphocytidyl-2-C-methyl-D-erythritol kinase